MSLKEQIEEWEKKIGFNRLTPYDTGEVEYALNLTKDISSLSESQIDQVVMVLSTYLIYVGYQMGTEYARIRYLETAGKRGDLALCRAKLSKLKPWYDAIELKISVLKKIYDRKIREAYNASGSRR